MTSGTYKGVKYEEVGPGAWRLRWPSGVRSTVALPDEAAVKAMIDNAAEGWS